MLYLVLRDALDLKEELDSSLWSLHPFQSKEFRAALISYPPPFFVSLWGFLFFKQKSGQVPFIPADLFLLISDCYCNLFKIYDYDFPLYFYGAN